MKALNDEELSPQEEQRLYVVICELTYAAIATVANQEAAGNPGYGEVAPRVVARELRSAALRKIWARVADDLTVYQLSDFASAVTERFDTEEARS